MCSIFCNGTKFSMISLLLILLFWAESYCRIGFYKFLIMISKLQIMAGMGALINTKETCRIVFFKKIVDQWHVFFQLNQQISEVFIAVIVYLYAFANQF